MYFHCCYFYFSTDIDTIEIRSDEEEGSGATKTRRTYNYRVCKVTHCTGFTASNYLVLLVERKSGNEVEKSSCCLQDNYPHRLCTLKRFSLQFPLPLDFVYAIAYFFPRQTSSVCFVLLFLSRVIFGFASVSFYEPLD